MRSSIGNGRTWINCVRYKFIIRSKYEGPIKLWGPDTILNLNQRETYKTNFEVDGFRVWKFSKKKNQKKCQKHFKASILSLCCLYILWTSLRLFTWLLTSLEFTTMSSHNLLGKHVTYCINRKMVLLEFDKWNCCHLLILLAWDFLVYWNFSNFFYLLGVGC